MISLKKYGRRWHIYGDESLLEPWAKDVEQIQGKPVQKDSCSAIWRVTSDDRRKYYVKRERCFHFPFTRSNAEKEFLAFALLEEKGIPCMECSAWSATFDDSIVVTKALPSKFSSLLKYWYSAAEINTTFLQNLCNFLTDTARAGISLPDLSVENLMTDGENIVIANPAGARDAESTNAPGPDFLKSLEMAFGEVPVEQIAELLHKSGMYSSEDEAFSVLKEMKAKWEVQTEELWKELQPGLLSESSKYVTRVKPETFYRNSAWFTPILQYPENVLEVKVLPEHEAAALWLDSFHAQLQKKSCSEIPVIYRKNGSNVELSVLKEKKYSFFYGFR